jgi:hypothetical protein
MTFAPRERQSSTVALPMPEDVPRSVLLGSVKLGRRLMMIAEGVYVMCTGDEDDFVLE